MKKSDFKYEIVEILGTTTQDVDIKSGWCKAVLKTLLNGDSEGVDIRNFKKGQGDETNLMAKGIRLDIQEAHAITDILVSSGYGSTGVLEKELKKRGV